MGPSLLSMSCTRRVLKIKEDTMLGAYGKEYVSGKDYWRGEYEQNILYEILKELKTEKERKFSSSKMRNANLIRYT